MPENICVIEKLGLRFEFRNHRGRIEKRILNDEDHSPLDSHVSLWKPAAENFLNVMKYEHPELKSWIENLGKKEKTRLGNSRRKNRMRRSVFFDMSKIIIERIDDEKFYFHLKSRNGKKLLLSSRFDSKDDCHRAISIAKELLKDKRNIVLKKTVELEPYFVIENERLQIRSLTYASHANLKESIDNIQRLINEARIVDRA